MHRIVLGCLLAWTGCGPVLAIGTTFYPNYRIVPITPPDPDLAFIQVHAINDASAVVGRYRDFLNPRDRAFVWDAVGGLRDLIALNEDGPRVQVANPANGVADEAFDINNSGAIVGRFVGGGNEAQVWLTETLLEYPNADLIGDNIVRAVAINAAGVVAGQAFIQGDNRGVTYDGGVVTSLPLAAGGSRNLVVDINDAGVAVGQELIPNPGGGTNSLPIVWFPDGQVKTANLGSSGLSTANINSINNAGRLAGAGGQSFPGEPEMPVAAIWLDADAEPTLLLPQTILPDQPASRFQSVSATFVGENGWVLGVVELNFGIPVIDPSVRRSFFWSPEGGTAIIEDLLVPEDAGWTIRQMAAFNSHGIGVADGFDPDGNQRAFLLVPVTVPEPASWVALLLAVLAASSMAARRTAGAAMQAINSGVSPGSITPSGKIHRPDVG